MIHFWVSNLGRISKTVKIDKKPLLNPRIFEIWDLKNAISRADFVKKDDFRKNTHSRAGNDSNHVFFKKKFNLKNWALNRILAREKEKNVDFWIKYFQNYTLKCVFDWECCKNKFKKSLKISWYLFFVSVYRRK